MVGEEGKGDKASLGVKDRTVYEPASHVYLALDRYVVLVYVAVALPKLVGSPQSS